jgi:hypothetical protein
MDIYHVSCDLKPGVIYTDFAERVAAYLGHLKNEGLIEGWRLTRRKLGLTPAEFRKFHLMIETSGLAQLQSAFERVASRDEPVESLHFDINALAANAVFALYRDFPDAVRRQARKSFSKVEDLQRRHVPCV